MWRGFAVRNVDPVVRQKMGSLRSARTEDHVRQLTKELQATAAALQNERRLRVLMTEAIKALHKQVSYSYRRFEAMRPMINSGPHKRFFLSNQLYFENLKSMPQFLPNLIKFHNQIPNQIPRFEYFDKLPC
jgi:hypothetical protein